VVMERSLLPEGRGARGLLMLGSYCNRAPPGSEPASSDDASAYADAHCGNTTASSEAGPTVHPVHSLELRRPGFSHSLTRAGNHCILNAMQHIQRGEVDIMLAGASDAAVIPVGIAGYSACKALSKRNDDPPAASRPWDQNRDGFVMGEGAGVLVLVRIYTHLLPSLPGCVWLCVCERRQEKHTCVYFLSAFLRTKTPGV